MGMEAPPESASLPTGRTLLVQEGGLKLARYSWLRACGHVPHRSEPRFLDSGLSMTRLPPGTAEKQVTSGAYSKRSINVQALLSQLFLYNS